MGRNSCSWGKTLVLGDEKGLGKSWVTAVNRKMLSGILLPVYTGGVTREMQQHILKEEFDSGTLTPELLTT